LTVFKLHPAGLEPATLLCRSSTSTQKECHRGRISGSGPLQTSLSSSLIESYAKTFRFLVSELAGIFDRLVFDPNSFWKIDAFRASTGEKLVEGQKVNFEAEDCIGRKGRCILKNTAFEGRTRNEVDQYLPPDPDVQPPGEPKMVPKSNQPF
jgi:hypothetical protein